MTEYRIVRKQKQRILVIQIHGEVDTSNYEEFNQEIERAVKEAETDILIDMTGTIGINSNGWGTFYRLKDTCLAGEKALIFCGMSPFLRSIAAMLKFEDFFNVTDTCEEGERQLEKND